MTQTIVVVPCYNEAARFDGSCFAAFLQSADDVSVLLVNDGSTDDTLAVLRDLQRRRPRQVLLHDLPENVGKAEAVRQGMLAAFQRRPDYVAYLDADLATPLEAILEFRRVLDDAVDIQLVMGSRVALLGRRIERRPARHLLGRAFATCASLVLKLAVYDTQCGAKMFRARPQIEALFQIPFRSRWIFDVEILARIVHADPSLGLPPAERSVYECPLRQWRDVAGSKLKPVDFVKAALELLTVYRAYSDKRPYRVETSTLELPSTEPSPPPPRRADSSRQQSAQRAA